MNNSTILAFEYSKFLTDNSYSASSGKFLQQPCRPVMNLPLLAQRQENTSVSEVGHLPEPQRTMASLFMPNLLETKDTTVTTWIFSSKEKNPLIEVLMRTFQELGVSKSSHYNEQWLTIFQKYLSEQSREADSADELNIPSDVNDFCRKHNCEMTLRMAVEMVQQSFTRLEEMRLSLECDDETDLQMVVIEVKVCGSVNRILEEYDQYTEKWVTAVSWPERSHFRLLYNIVAP